MDIVFLLIGLLVGAGLGFLLARVLRGGSSGADVSGRVAELETQLAATTAALHESQLRIERERGELAGSLSAAETARDELRKQLEQAQESFRALNDQHKAEIAIREERERAEKKVLTELAPVKETLSLMQQRVSEMEKQRSEQFGQITEQLKQAQVSDEQLRQATESLSKVLNDNSSRGVWGEAQLRRVVEAAGLLRHVDFGLQETSAGESGANRPDLVVYLPGGKSLAVDSKAPMNAYFEASQLGASVTGGDAAKRKELLDKHVKALKLHIDALAKKEYWASVGVSPDFVVAFVPNESMLSAALDADPMLLEYAFAKGVALASPVSLWSVLKTIAFTWRQQEMSDEAKKLFQLGNELYARLSTMAGHVNGMRSSLETTVKKFNQFVSSLESRVLVTARKFPGLVEERIAPLGQIEEAPRLVNADELESAEAHLESLLSEVDELESAVEAELEAADAELEPEERS